ncbi:MAG: radical SAM protein [Planctomycetes bacterium]|nr:radical SAM protein [Planctomycetota bacterium]
MGRGDFQAGEDHGITCGFVSNGNGTPEVLKFLRPHVDLYKVDLKSFDDRHYRELGGVLSNVLATIEQLVSMGFWVEIVTLVIPGFNDSDGELQSIAKFIAGVSRDIPWPATAFHPEYKMMEPGRTPAETLLRAHEFGRAAGLHYVYPGNIPGAFGDLEHTFCRNCKAMVIDRYGFYVRENRMTRPGHCPECDENIPGVFEADAPRRSEGTGIPMPVLFS